jgi:hypothetical protein
MGSNKEGWDQVRRDGFRCGGIGSGEEEWDQLRRDGIR